MPSPLYTARKIPLIYSFSGKRATSVPVSTLRCLWAIYIFPGSVHIFPCSRIGRPILEIYKSLTDIWVYRNWETGHINSVLEITDSILRIHKWEPDIYIGFSAAFHLQWLPPQHLFSIYSIVVKSTEVQSPRYVEQSTQFMSTGIDS